MLSPQQRIPSLAEILQIENDAAVVDRLCPVTGLPVWPQVRVAYLRAILSDLVYNVELTGKSQSRASATQAARALGRYAMHNLRHRLSGRHQAAVCIFGDGVANQFVDGKWINRLSDHFVAARPAQTLVVEDHFEWRWPFPRHQNNVIFHVPLQAASAVFGRLSVGRDERLLARSLVDLVTERAQHYLQWTPGAARHAALVEMLAQKIAAMPRQLSAYTRLLKRTRPQVLMVNAGCYGPAAALIAAAKEQGIATAEFQHGAISLGHDGYNFAAAVLSSKHYLRTLPDYLLTYGNWWGTQSNAPVQKLAIGSPHRFAKSCGPTTPKTDLLVLSDGLDIERYLVLVRTIRAQVAQTGLRLVLRPHPLERTRVNALPASLKEGFVVDTNPDIYTSFRSARAVVSEVSTGLFEAVGLVDEIFMWATPRTVFTYPAHPFTSFETAEALAALLGQEGSGRLEGVNASDIWADNWKQRYEVFLAAQGVPACAAK